MPTVLNSEKLVWTSGSSCDGGTGVTVGTRSDMHPGPAWQPEGQSGKA